MWLLESSVRTTLEAAARAGIAPTAEQLQSLTAMPGGGMHIMSVAGDTAEISIKGVLTNEPNFMAMLFGGGNTTYGDIISAINDAEMNPSVTSIVFNVDSPGGSVDGMFDAISAVQHMKKNKRAIASNKVASAAYALISQMGEVTAVNKACTDFMTKFMEKTEFTQTFFVL